MHRFNFRETKIWRRPKIVNTTERASHILSILLNVNYSLGIRNLVLVQLGAKWIKSAVSSERLKH